MRPPPRFLLSLHATGPANRLQRARREHYGNDSTVLLDFNAAQCRDVVKEPAEIVFRVGRRDALHIF